MKINYSLGHAVLGAALLATLTGCTTYVTQQPEPQRVYVPAPPPEPAPVYVQQASPPPAVVVIQSEDDFVQPLSPYGDWVVVGDYGRVWRPAHVETNWRPYANGHWESTGDGWYWVSDEPWAWATYHYGRWQLAAGYGWVWVPQTQWAPAWVSWREGGGYVGWAPLPPESRGGVSVSVTIAPAAFCFVEERHMHDPVRPTTVIVNNTTIINKTVNITKTKIVNKTVINEGPRTDQIERATGQKIQQRSVADLRHQDEEPVAEKHQNLRARPNQNSPDQRPAQNQPAPQRPAQRPSQQITRDNQKPAHVEPTRTIAPSANVPPQHDAPPADNNNTRERQQTRPQQQQQQQERLQQQQEKQRQQAEQDAKKQQEKLQQQPQPERLPQQQPRLQQPEQKQPQPVQPAPSTQQQRQLQGGRPQNENPPRTNRAADRNQRAPQSARTNATENPTPGASR